MSVSVTRTVKYILKGDKGDKGDATIIYGVVPSSNYVIIDPNSDNSSTPSYITVKIKQTSGVLVNYPNSIPTGYSLWYKNNTDTQWASILNNGYVYQEGWDISDYIEIALTSDTNQPSAANVISSITVPFIKSGVNGSDNYLLDLANEMSAVACDEDGVIDDNAELEATTAFIYKGAILNPGWTYVVSKDGSQVATFTDPTGKGYTFTPTIAMLTSDLNTFDIYATKGSIGTLAAIYTVKKVYSGTPGAPGSAGKNAVLYQINLSADAITIDNNNNAAPSDCIASIKVNNGGVITYLSQPPSGYKMWKKSQVDSSWADASVDSFIIFQNDRGNTRYGRYINVALTSDPNSPKSDFSNVVDFETLPFIMDGDTGKDGVGIVSTTVTYQIGSSGTVAPTGTWSSSVPTAVPGSYLWTKTVWNYSDNTSETGYSVSKYGERGNTGPTLRGPQSWSDCAVGYAFQAGGNSDTWKDVVMYGDNYYSCVKSHTKTSTNYPTSTEDNNNGYWQLGDKIELVATKILLATYALVKNLGVEAIDMKDNNGNILFQAKDGNVICKTGTFENITFSGTMKGVSGSFKSLDCVNESGTKVGGIRFGSDGKMWFDGDLYNQGYDYDLQRGYRFYSADLWCRGSFGARQRNTAVVIGTTIRYYTKGLDNSSYVQATLSPSTVSGQLCYTIPLYGTTDDYAGFPIDTVIFLPSSGTYYYRLIATAGKKVTLIGANDTNGDIKILSAGGYIDLNEGGYMDAIYLGSLYLPSTSNPGAGWLFSAQRDNNWG